MSTVETVRGSVHVAELGPTLMHEHVFVLQPEALQNYGHVWGASYWDEEVRIRDAIVKLGALRAGESGRWRTDRAGARAIHPADPARRRRGRPQHRRRDGRLRVPRAAQLPRLLLGRRDRRAVRPRARQGIDDTGVRAAFLAPSNSTASSATPRILDAIAAAAIETGAPVMVHTNARAATGFGAPGADVEGVDPTRIVIAHAGDSNDLTYLRAIADTGAVLASTASTSPHFNPDADRIRTLLALLEEGYGDRVHLSHDAACFYDFMVGDPNFADERPDYLHVSTTILPALLQEASRRSRSTSCWSRTRAASSSRPRNAHDRPHAVGVREAAGCSRRARRRRPSSYPAFLARIREHDGAHSHEGDLARSTPGCAHEEDALAAATRADRRLSGGAWREGRASSADRGPRRAGRTCAGVAGKPITA